MRLGSGVRYQNNNLRYVSFKKHYCPHCKTQVKTVMVERMVERNSPEGKDFNFRFKVGNTYILVDEATFRWKEFECPNCNTHFTIKEMQQIEGVYKEPTENSGQTLKQVLQYLLPLALFLLFSYLYKQHFGA